jgi:hypothetical protein
MTFRPQTKFCLFLLSSEDSEIQILVRARAQISLLTRQRLLHVGLLSLILFHL